MRGVSQLFLRKIKNPTRFWVGFGGARRSYVWCREISNHSILFLFLRETPIRRISAYIKMIQQHDIVYCWEIEVCMLVFVIAIRPNYALPRFVGVCSASRWLNAFGLSEQLRDFVGCHANLHLHYVFRRKVQRQSWAGQEKNGCDKREKYSHFVYLFRKEFVFHKESLP